MTAATETRPAFEDRCLVCGGGDKDIASLTCVCQSAPDPAALAAQTREFYCPRWPGCQCPDGTVALDCPGRTIQGRTIAAPSGQDDATGGPAAAPKASPAAAANGPDGAATDFRQAMEDAPRPMPPFYRVARQQPATSLKARAEAILTEMRNVLQRSDHALWMIKSELAHRQDLLDASFAAHVDMGFVQRDLAAMIKDL